MIDGISIADAVDVVFVVFVSHDECENTPIIKAVCNNESLALEKKESLKRFNPWVEAWIVQ